MSDNNGFGPCATRIAMSFLNVPEKRTPFSFLIEVGYSRLFFEHRK